MKDVTFSQQLVYAYPGSHVPFMEGPEHLENAIDKYLKKFSAQL